VKIGDWRPAQLGSATNLLEWGVPPQMLSPGKYRLSLDYSQGKQELGIHWAALLENGQELSRDTHEGLAGAGYNRAPKARAWNYFLELPAVKPDAKYSVRVSAGVSVALTGAGDGVPGMEGGLRGKTNSLPINSAGVVFLEPPTVEANK